MKQVIRWVAQLAVILGLVSCSSSDSPPATLFDGSRDTLSNIYSESQLVITESLGFVMNFGDDPPVVDGTFRIEPLMLQAKSDPSDALEAGITLNPFNVVFSNQDNDLLKLDVSIVPDSGEELIEITNAVISGSGNAFSVFALAVLPAANGLETRMAFSGVITEFGIENFQYAPFLAGDGDDAVRLFVDQDNLSDKLN